MVSYIIDRPPVLDRKNMLSMLVRTEMRAWAGRAGDPLPWDCHSVRLDEGSEQGKQSVFQRSASREPL